MNSYNPYFYSMPTAMSTPKVGLFSRLLGGNGITLGGILNGTQRALNFANQAIPLVKQVRPMIGNAKTMFKVMNEFKRVEKPKSEYVSHKRKSLTIEEERKLVEYLNNVSYEECSYKYLLLWQLTTGMRIGETLVLDYKKDIILSENKVEIRKTQTKDDKGNIIIGDTTKTENGRRTLTMNNISRQIMEKALEHKIKNKNNLLFCTKDGNMHLENSINSC